MVILVDSQYGFRSDKAIDGAVHELTDYVQGNLDSGSKCNTISLDLTKAFDTVSVLYDVGAMG